MSTLKRITLLISSRIGFGRQIQSGIAAYAREQGRWQFFSLWPEGQEQEMDFDLSLDGIIMWADNPQQIARLEKWQNIPMVRIGRPSDVGADTDFYIDDRSVGRQAALHLMEYGYRRFAYVCDSSFLFRMERVESFCDTVKAEGFTAESFLFTHSKKQIEEMAAWLKSLPEPCGMFAPTDPYGRIVTIASLQADIKIPEYLAVVASGNDELYCELTTPQLSSVNLPGFEIGYRAAQLLQYRLDHGQTPPRLEKIPATRVTIRHSSDMLSIADPVVLKALEFIRDHSSDAIKVTDVHEHVPASRRALEVRFKKHTGYSLHEAIWRTHLRRAQSLLLDTNLLIGEIALLSGFSNIQVFSNVFTQKMGMSPKTYRAKHRAGRTVIPGDQVLHF